MDLGGSIWPVNLKAGISDWPKPILTTPQALKWSCFLGQVRGLAKMHQVGFHAAFSASVCPKYAVSGVRLSRAV
jgi:hypothetical protein